ncbi:MAG: S8 family serine peptidase, partial [Gammaproteobacteria bacterium]|nr:S8 family serine peptidase [Gammaproteobacteria bacterium]
GEYHTCALKGDGSAVCWGYNKLGFGDLYTGQATPPAGTFSQISAGAYHTCALNTDGSAVCWGVNRAGQATPPATSVFSQISMGGSHACALKNDGNAVCWGSHIYNANYTDQATPPAGTFRQISTGKAHTCALKGDGSAVCWGLNDYGQATPPVGIFSQISAGDYYTCALKSDGSAVCWGSNDDGQATPPAGVFTQISAGASHTCALKTGGSAVCWGRNNYHGQATPPAETFRQISTGKAYTCALKSDGSAVCWGNNFSNGNYTGQATPPVGTFSQINAGGSHTCALKTDGSVVCWGDNHYGQTAPPAGVFSQISVHDDTSCALKSDGSTVCWGYFSYNREAPPPAETFTLTVSGSGALTGTGINCGTDCIEEYPFGGGVTLAASPATDWHFSQWGGDCSGTDARITVIMDATKSCTAVFTQIFTLTVGVNGTGTVTGIGIDCGTDCAEEYPSGSGAALAVAPASGWRFSQWGGDCSGTDAIIMVAMDAAKNCTATFTQINQPPVASFSAVPASGPAPLRVMLDESASYDPDGEILSYEWRVNGTPLSQDGGVLEKSVPFNAPGTYTISLIVTDNDGLTGQAERIIEVSDNHGSLSIDPTQHHFGNVPVLPPENISRVRSGNANRPVPAEAYVPNRVIVKFREGTMEAARQVARNRHQASLIRELNLINAELWWVDDAPGTVAAHAREPDPAIQYIEPDYIATTNAIPNDADFDLLWAMHNDGQFGGTPGADINAPAAWDTSQGHNGPVCAVIDTGVDYTHPDLTSNLWRNPGEIPGNGIDDDGNGYIDDVYGYDFADKDGDPMDDHGHGTHVAGTMAAAGDNGIGVAGINWSGRIMALRWMKSSIFGPSGKTSDAILALEYATRMGVKCTNNSWRISCIPGFDEDKCHALRDAIQGFGGLFVAAAGNSGFDNDRTPMYPASYPLDNIISVCATDNQDRLANFSHYGAVSVDLCAPGVKIYSTLLGNEYGLKNGTSMAAPHVAGAAALLWAEQPDLTAAQIKAKLMASADVKPALKGRSFSGGRLNLDESLHDLPQPQVFTVTNTETSAVSLSSAVLDGQNPADFTILDNNCSGSLSPGGACTVKVSFTPAEAGGKQAVLRISGSGNANVVAALSGEAVAVISPTGLDFVPAAPAVFDIGTAQVSLPSVYLEGSTLEQFSATLCPATDDRFKVCELNEQTGDPQAFEQAGNAIYHPETGILEIPFIRLSDAPDNEEAGIVIDGYSVELQTLTLPDGNVNLEVKEVIPIW